MRTEVNTKPCRVCGAHKPLDDFYVRLSSADGLRTECKACHAARGTVWRRANPHYQARAVRRLRYGVTDAEFTRLRALYAGCCHLCRGPLSPGRGTTVDHDHETGHVRGLLCPRCNSGLGYFGDNEAGLLRALAYLQKERGDESSYGAGGGTGAQT